MRSAVPTFQLINLQSVTVFGFRSLTFGKELLVPGYYLYTKQHIRNEESVEFEIDKTVKKTKRSAKLGDRTLTVNSGVKAKHLIQLEKSFGTDLGDVEKGLRLLALMLFESMGGEAITYDELIEYELTELEPILSLIK